MCGDIQVTEGWWKFSQCPHGWDGDLICFVRSFSRTDDKLWTITDARSFSGIEIGLILEQILLALHLHEATIKAESFLWDYGDFIKGNYTIYFHGLRDHVEDAVLRHFGKWSAHPTTSMGGVAQIFHAAWDGSGDPLRGGVDLKAKMIHKVPDPSNWLKSWQIPSSQRSSGSFQTFRIMWIRRVEKISKRCR